MSERVRRIVTAEPVKCWRNCPVGHSCVEAFQPELQDGCVEKLQDQFGSEVEIDVKGSAHPTVRISAGGHSIAKFDGPIAFPDYRS